MSAADSSNILNRLELSHNLRGSLQRAAGYAHQQSHREVTLEHLLLALIDDIATRPVRTLMVRPYVFRLDHVPDFRPNHEVAGLHVHSLDRLLEGEGRGPMRWPSRVGIRLPRVDFDGVRLWGLTLQMVDVLLDRIDGLMFGAPVVFFYCWLRCHIL